MPLIRWARYVPVVDLMAGQAACYLGGSRPCSSPVRLPHSRRPSLDYSGSEGSGLEMDTLALVQRSIIWLVLGVVVVGISVYFATRLLNRTNDDRDPTIVGALTFLKVGEKLGAAPLYTFVGDIWTRSAVIGVGLTGGPQPATVRIILSNVKQGSCTPSGVRLLAGPTNIGKDTSFYSFHQAHIRDIFMLEVEVPANTTASISCDVTDPPERETFVTRRIAFAPPTNSDIEATVREGGYEPLWPAMVSIQRVTESTAFVTSGGKRVHDNPIGATTEASYLTPQDPILRAYWSDERARTYQTFGLFFLAVTSAVGAAMLVEALRPWIERLSA